MDKRSKYIDYANNQDLAVFDELLDIEESLSEVAKALKPFEGIDVGSAEQIKGEKGEEGYSPVKGKDYFTNDEIDRFLRHTTPKKGVHYFDGEDGRPGTDGRDGESIPGERGADGKDGSPDSPQDIATKLNSRP